MASRARPASAEAPMASTTPPDAPEDAPCPVNAAIAPLATVCCSANPAIGITSPAATILGMAAENARLGWKKGPDPEFAWLKRADQPQNWAFRAFAYRKAPEAKFPRIFVM